MMRILGWRAVLRYLAGKMSLNDALGHLSQHIELRVGAVMLPFPEAAVDVDTVSDWKFVQSLVEKQNFCNISPAVENLNDLMPDIDNPR